jgi:glycosyltransferase involved in cell wall biosynthesis
LSAPKVSVFVLTHNHAAWIGQALDSAVAQRAPFSFEILVADDFSTDGTREVVREYERRHPELVRTFLPERNLGVAGIWLTAARQCRGEYIALLEGDDHWTSAEKLARQVPLLDANPDWASCFHRATLFHDDGRRPPRPATPGFDRDVFVLDDLIRANFIPFLTVMFRRDALATIPKWLFSYPWFDWLFHIYCARRGAIGFLDEDMAAYRVHERGNWSARSRADQLELDLELYQRLAAELPEKRGLIERCGENRRCQLAIELSATPASTAVALCDPEGEMPAYFNGRRAGSVGLGAGAGKLAEIAAGSGGEELHYAPRQPPRQGKLGRWCACVVPRSLDPALAAGGRLTETLGAGGEPAWSDEWCRVWELEVDSLRGDQAKEEGTDASVGALVEIADVSRQEPPSPLLLAGYIDEPRPGSVHDVRALELLGWAIGADRRAVAVELSVDGEVFWRAPLRAERPDLAEAYPERTEAARAGFRTTLNLIGTPAEFELEVSAVLKGQQRAPLGTIRGRHRWRRDHSPAFAELVSVVIPCYGQAHYLGEAIESVLAQTYPHLEIVVVDDESADNASQIAARYPGVRCVRERNSGMAGARNVGIRCSNGDFLVFLDSDDRLLPDAVEAGLAALERRPECACAVGTYRRTSHDGKPLNTHDQPVVERDQYARLMLDNWAGFPARALYRRSLFEHVRGFDQSLDAAADFGFNLAIARQFPIASHGALVAEHREHGRNSSGDAAKMLRETLAAMRQQRAHVKRDANLRHAYREGVRHWKAYYGELLAAQAGESWREGRRRQALREAAILARYRPSVLPSLLAGNGDTAA